MKQSISLLAIVAVCTLAQPASAGHAITWSPGSDLEETITPDGPILSIPYGFTATGVEWPCRIVRIEIPAGEHVVGARLNIFAEHRLQFAPGAYQDTDSETGLASTYSNPLGNFASSGDIEAFPELE